MVSLGAAADYAKSYQPKEVNLIQYISSLNFNFIIFYSPLIPYNLLKTIIWIFLENKTVILPMMILIQELKKNLKFKMPLGILPIVLLNNKHSLSKITKLLILDCILINLIFLEKAVKTLQTFLLFNLNPMLNQYKVSFSFQS